MASAKALAARLPPTLEVLKLSSNPLGDEGVVALAASLPPTLRELDLNGTHFAQYSFPLFSRPFLSCILSCPYLSYIAETAVGDRGCRALASALHPFVSLEKLNICNNATMLAHQNKISDEAVTALVDSLPQGITSLHLDGLANS